MRFRYCFFVAVAAFLLQVSCQSMSPNTIRRAASLPDSTPWNLTELSQVPAFAWGEGTEIRSLYYQGEPYNGHATRVFAYYATPGTLAGDPSMDKDLPAMVLVHGGGGTAFPEWVKLWASRGYAAMAMDLAGCGPERERLADGGPDQSPDLKFRAIDLPVTEQWTYHAVANVIRAHSLIRSFPEVDADRTAITGISWGGYTTCIVAGLDNRFKAAVPVYGCGFIYEDSSWNNEFAKMTAEQKAKWIQLWDPSQYVGSAAMPMLFVNGGTDFHYRPEQHAKTMGLVQSSKNLCYLPQLKHGHIFDRPEAIEVFMDQQLKGGIPLVRVAAPAVDGAQVTAMVDAKTHLVSAELHYTLDPLAVNPRERTWTSKSATLSGSRIVADLPPEDATIWFFTVKDERGTTVSSALVFPHNEGHMK
jgi:dienelactone hydrolase